MTLSRRDLLKQGAAFALAPSIAENIDAITHPDAAPLAPLARETRIDPVTTRVDRVDRNEYATMGTMAAADPLVCTV